MTAIVQVALVGIVCALSAGYAWYLYSVHVRTPRLILEERLSNERESLRESEDSCASLQTKINALRGQRSHKVEARIRAVQSVTETLIRLNIKLAEARQLVDWMADKPESRDRILTMNRDWKAADNEWLQFDQFGMTESKGAFRKWMVLSGSALNLAYTKSDVFCTFPDSPQKYERLLSLSEQVKAAFKEADDFFELLGPIFNHEIEKDVI